MGAAIGFSFETKAEKRKTCEIGESLTTIRQKKISGRAELSTFAKVGGGETFGRSGTNRVGVAQVEFGRLFFDATPLKGGIDRRRAIL